MAALQPFSTKVFSWFLVTIVALIAAFLVRGEYARKETVVGYLTPTSGTSKVFVPQQGIIREIHVKDGQEVEEGQPLLTVETSQIAANGRDVNADMLESLNSQQDHLNKQIVAEQKRGQSEQRRLTDLIAGVNAEIAQLEVRLGRKPSAPRFPRSLSHLHFASVRGALWPTPSLSANSWTRLSNDRI